MFTVTRFHEHRLLRLRRKVFNFPFKNTSCSIRPTKCRTGGFNSNLFIALNNDFLQVYSYEAVLYCLLINNYQLTNQIISSPTLFHWCNIKHCFNWAFYWPDFCRNKWIFKKCKFVLASFSEFARGRLTKQLACCKKKSASLDWLKDSMCLLREIQPKQQTCRRHWFWLSRNASVCERTPTPIMSINWPN